MKSKMAMITFKSAERLAAVSNSDVIYAPIIKVGGEAWSLVVNVKKLLSDTECEAEVHFLFDEAPVHMLSDGAKFSLYEGSRLVADGEIKS